MMDASEIAVLRTKLREVNVEYSMLVRNKAGETRFVRMGQLRSERRALVELIARERELKAPVPDDALICPGALSGDVRCSPSAHPLG